jgi:hypothetical protein
MRIQTIEITDYKAFLGTHKINVGGKTCSFTVRTAAAKVRSITL